MKKFLILSAILLGGCSILQPPPIGVVLTPEARIEALQKDLNTSYDALVLAHTLGAFKDPKQWETVLTFEASAQQALNLASTALKNGDIVDLDTLLKDANAAILNFKTKSK